MNEKNKKEGKVGGQETYESLIMGYAIQSIDWLTNNYYKNISLGTQAVTQHLFDAFMSQRFLIDK